jgi:hypothetical protein
MTEQRLSAQNPRELTANEWDQVTGGASDLFFPGRDSPGLLRNGRTVPSTMTQPAGSDFNPTTVTGSTVAGNGGAGTPGTPISNGALVVSNHHPNP